MQLAVFEPNRMNRIAFFSHFFEIECKIIFGLSPQWHLVQIMTFISFSSATIQEKSQCSAGLHLKLAEWAIEQEWLQFYFFRLVIEISNNWPILVIDSDKVALLVQRTSGEMNV